MSETPPLSEKPKVNHTPLPARFIKWLYHQAIPQPPEPTKKTIIQSGKNPDGSVVTKTHTLNPDGTGKLEVTHSDPFSNKPDTTHTFHIKWQHKHRGKKRNLPKNK